MFLCSFHCITLFFFLSLSFFQTVARPLTELWTLLHIIQRNRGKAETLNFMSLYSFTPITETIQNISNSSHSERNLRVPDLLYFLFLSLSAVFFFFSITETIDKWTPAQQEMPWECFSPFLPPPFFLLSHIRHMKLQTLLWIWRWGVGTLSFQIFF